MKRIKRALSSNYRFIVITVIFGAFFFYLNCITPLIDDDWHFKFIWTNFSPVDNPKISKSFDDLMVSCKNYYMASGGRIICHFFSFLFARMNNKMLFNVINCIIYIIFISLFYKMIYVYAKTNNPEYQPNPIHFSLSAFSLFFIMPYTENFLWISGAINYLWPCTLTLYCHCWIITDFEKANKNKYRIMFFLIALSAATNEVTGGILGLSFIFAFIKAGNKISFAKKASIYLGGIIAGISLVIFAPGNKIRSNVVEPPSSIISSAIDYLEFFAIYLTGFAIILVLIKVFLKQKSHRKKDVCSVLYDINGIIIGISAICILSFAKTCIPRAAFFGLIFFFANILGLIYSKDIEHQIHKIVKKGLSVAGIFFIFWYIGNNTNEYAKWLKKYTDFQADALNGILSEAENINKFNENGKESSVFIPFVGYELTYEYTWILANHYQNDKKALEELSEQIKQNPKVHNYQDYYFLDEINNEMLDALKEIKIESN